MKTNRIIDTHVHIWDLDRGRYSWLDGDTSILKKSYAFQELLPEMEAAEVTDCILVQAANTLDDTERMLRTAREYKEVIGVVGWLPLVEPEETHNLLTSGLVSDPYFKGVRHLIHNESDPRWLLQEAVLESLKTLVEYNLPFDVVGTSTDHLETILEVAHRLPDLRMVLDHLNQPPIARGAAFGRWGELMKAAARQQNIYAKISGLGTAAAAMATWSKSDIKPYIMYVLDLFGVDRCLCGGDWPVSLLALSYKDTWKIYKEIITEELSGEDQLSIWYKNASLFYNI